MHKCIAQLMHRCAQTQARWLALAPTPFRGGESEQHERVHKCKGRVARYAADLPPPVPRETTSS